MAQVERGLKDPPVHPPAMSSDATYYIRASDKGNLA